MLAWTTSHCSYSKGSYIVIGQNFVLLSVTPWPTHVGSGEWAKILADEGIVELGGRESLSS